MNKLSIPNYGCMSVAMQHATDAILVCFNFKWSQVEFLKQTAGENSFTTLPFGAYMHTTGHACVQMPGLGLEVN